MAKTLDEARFLMSTTESPKYHIGERCHSGTIVEILNGHLYYAQHNKTNYETWDKYDPWWKEKHIYTLYLDNPARPLSFEQYQNLYIKNHPELATKYDYENNIDYVLFMAVCEAMIDQEGIPNDESTNTN